MSDSTPSPLDPQLFAGFSADDRAALSALFAFIPASLGTILFEQGEATQNLYLVVSGEVAVRYKPEDGPALVITRVRKDGLVGWSAVIGSRTYTSSAVCISDCHLLSVRSVDLRQFVEQRPQAGQLLLERLAALIAVRMRNTHAHVIALIEQGLRQQIPPNCSPLQPPS
ncbi:MAG: Crp/Fnr family transcriptional regulator [Chloroflexota bacterium]